MEARTVDVAIIGAGSAGLNARWEVLNRGGSVLLIESGPYGTTCARVGCMPSKLLIAAADTAHEVAGAGRFGINVGSDAWSIDGAAVMDRVRRERDRFAGFVIDSTNAFPEAERLCGHARFTGPTTLLVDDKIQVDAKAIVVAAGGSPWLPPPFDAVAEHVMVNDDVFELTDLPITLAVIGTGIIGLELGQALSRLGVKTTFFSPFDDLGPFSDPEIKPAVSDILGSELDFELNSKISSAVPGEGSITLEWADSNGAKKTRSFERVLVTAGRKPNLEGLDLVKTGLLLDERGRPPWNPQTTQSGDLPVFLAGDVSGHRPLLHEATDEGRIAGTNAMLFPDISSHVRRTPLAIAFTDPQMAIAGQSYRELDADQIEIGEVSYADQGRARVMGQNRGLVRIYGDRKGCHIIGAEMFGPRVEHMAHLLSWAIQCNLTVQQTLQMPFYHPVVEEGLRTALRELAKKLRVTGECRSEDMAEAPGT